VGCRRICFTDSIGSFGGTSPRDGVSARWLVDNPTQDPGSDYGLQKRACRELMHDFAEKQNGDPRFAVLPGVLHSEPVWGNGTTEYALDALLAASLGKPYVCPVEPTVSDAHRPLPLEWLESGEPRIREAREPHAGRRAAAGACTRLSGPMCLTHLLFRSCDAR
jgi:hypothetical protein